MSVLLNILYTNLAVSLRLNKGLHSACFSLYRSVITMISSKISNQIQVCSCHSILVACTNYYNYSYQKYSEVDEGIKSVQKQYYRIVLHCYVMF
jgi:hypothetical protein